MACSGRAASEKSARLKPRSSVVQLLQKGYVLEAIANPREIDVPLVDAYLARRALDYLVGFHAVAGSVAQIARFALGTALGGTAPRLRQMKPRLNIIREEYWNIAACSRHRGNNFTAHDWLTTAKKPAARY